MKTLLSLNLLFLAFTFSGADDCGVTAMTKGIELYRDFQALHSRACHDLKINMDMYLMLRKECVKTLVKNFDYEDFGDLAYEFWETDCYKDSAVHTCSDWEYTKFKHCAFDFGMEHLDDALEIYKNWTLVTQLYNYGIEAKHCITKSLDEIEANHRFINIHV